MGLHSASCAGRPVLRNDDVPGGVLSALVLVGITAGLAVAIARS